VNLGYLQEAAIPDLALAHTYEDACNWTTAV